MKAKQNFKNSISILIATVDAIALLLFFTPSGYSTFLSSILVIFEFLNLRLSWLVFRKKTKVKWKRNKILKIPFPSSLPLSLQWLCCCFLRRLVIRRFWNQFSLFLYCFTCIRLLSSLGIRWKTHESETKF